MRDQPETVGQHGAPHGETILGGRSRQRRCCADVVHLVLGPIGQPDDVIGERERVRPGQLADSQGAR